MTNFQTKGWDLRNAWPLNTGEIATREALVTLGFLTNTTLLNCFTIRNQRTNVIWHITLDDTKISVLDENFTILQVITHGVGLPKGKVPFDCAIVEDELIITSPFLPTYWGIIGSGLILATKVASVNPNTTALNVPKGLCVGWSGRVVISDGQSMYFSDALAPRTFVAENTIDPPGGIIYGLHVNDGGALIIVTSTGVYALPEDAAASGQIVLGIFSKLTDYGAIDYQTSAISHGRVYGLTKKGYRLIDDKGSSETLLDEDVMSRSGIPRISFEDYRAGKLFGSELGPIVSISGYIHMHDLATETKSWWAGFDSSVGNTRRLDLQGLLYDNSGEMFFPTAYDGYALALYGNRDDLYGANEQTVGVVAGRIMTPPEASPVIRDVEFSTDSEETIEVFINNTSKTLTPSFSAPIIGTTVWGGAVYKEVPLKSRRVSFAIRGDEVVMELKTLEYPSRLPPIVDVQFRGPGKKRPNS